MSQFVLAVRALIIFSALFGAAYPAAMYLIGRVAFTEQVTGSIVRRNGVAVGSSLIAQPFAAERYFKPRPSAAEFGTLPSGASHFGPASKSLSDAVDARRAAWGNAADVPAELLFASGSGLDPHLTPEAVQFQVERVARARGLDSGSVGRLRELIQALTEGRQFGLFGVARVNVLALNLAVDEAFP